VNAPRRPAAPGITRYAATRGPDGWAVTWLPGRVLSHRQAVAAMRLARAAAAGLAPGDARWPAIDRWAARLGMTGTRAIVQAAGELPDDQASELARSLSERLDREPAPPPRRPHGN
jgi:hypothetical protein